MCIRDPRDFISSYKNIWQISGRRNRMTALYHPILTFLIWRSSIITTKSAIKTDTDVRIASVQYENLVSDPHEEVRKLCQFLDINMSPEMLDIDSHNSSFSDSPSRIFTTSVGRWVRTLDANEAYWVQKINNNIMTELGYELVSTHPRLGALIRDLMGFPFSFLKALYINRHSRGPTLTYLKARLQSFRN